MAATVTPAGILDAASASRAGAARVGGKAIGLARLAEAGAPVPWWFVLPTDAFAAHVAGVAGQIREALDGLTLDRVEEIGSALAEAVVNAPLAPVLAAAVTDAARGLSPLAVRSSVVGEDSAADSHAGLYDSYLFTDDVIESVLRCWASGFNPRALAYRLQRGLALEPPAIAVIVQEVVLGEVSGVLFTSNPVSGRRDEALVSACYGLGEGLVSGRCDADEFVYTHAGHELSATVATKDTEIVPAIDGGTCEAPVEPSRRAVRSLTPADVRRLVEAGLELAAGEPQDIEWTLADGEFVFLQSRPITTLPPAPLGHHRIVWDNSNIQESFNGVTTPLTFSVALRSYASIYEQTLHVLGVRGETLSRCLPAVRTMLGLVDGRVYYNINHWYQALLPLPGFDRNKADMEHMMGLEDPVDFVEGTALSRAETLRRLPGMLLVLARLRRRFRRLDRDVDAFVREFEAAVQSFDRTRLATASYGELIELAARVQTEIVDRWVVPIINDTYVMMTSGRLRKLVGDEAASAAMHGEQAIASAEPTRRLIELAGEIRADRELLDALLDGAPAHAWAQLRERSPSVRVQLDDYLDRFGDRCMGEMKLETISLRQDPAFLIRILRNFASQPGLETAGASPNGGPGSRRVRRAREDLHRGVAARERMRLARTRFVGLFREIYTAAGERLHEAGRLDDPRDVFYLTADELRALHDGTAVTGDLAALARLRKAEYAGYEAVEPPHHFETIGGERVVVARALVEDAHSLRGTGCSPGVVEAELHVITSPDDDLAVNGRILTTLRTDPGWAPLFPSAAGLLIERGSTLSHSAVLAREFGIPCVVGVPDLLARVRQGERVRLDGTTGTVERLS